MFSKQLFLERYTDLHERIIPAIIEGQPEAVLRLKKNSLNPIIWIYWHMVRTEDVGISRFILEEAQVYEEYAGRVNLKTTYNGTGMTKDEVKEAAVIINLEGLIKYSEAVKKKTLRLIDRADKIDLEGYPSRSLIDRIICDEKTMPENSWHLLDLYYHKSREWFLLHVSLTHPFYHLGQIATLLKLLRP